MIQNEKINKIDEKETFSKMITNFSKIITSTPKHLKQLRGLFFPRLIRL
jgi:hypothetical protein